MTNRLRFLDVDESASLPQPSAITGFTVIKSPRGTTAPQFFSKGNTTGLVQWLGAPSSNFPGIQEVLDFNQLYGIWVSSPPGNITGSVGNGLGVGNNLYSYFGGVYITTLGSLESFYQVSEDMTGSPVINNEVLLTAGNVTSPFTNTTLAPSYASNTVTIDKINPGFFTLANVSKIILTYPRSNGTTAIVNFTIKNSTELHAVDPTTSDDLTVGTLGTSSTSGYQKIDITGSADYDNAGNLDLNFTDGSPGGLDAWLTANVASLKVQWVYDISDYVIVPIAQTSPREYQGTFNLTTVDTRQNLYDSVSTQYTVSGSSGSAGTVYLCGTAVVLSTVDTSAHVAATLGSQVISGYTISYTSGSVFTVKSNKPSTPAPSLVVLPSSTFRGFTFTPSVTNNGNRTTNPSYNTATFTYTETYYGSHTYIKTYTVSTNPLAVDGYGQSTYILDVLAGDPFLTATEPSLQFTDTVASISIPPSSSLTIVWDAITTTLKGQRAAVNSSFVNSTMLAELLTEGWDLAGDNTYQNTQIFFDPECVSDIASIFSTYRAGTYKFSTFVTGIKVPNGIPTNSTELTTAVNAIVTARGTYPNLTGLAYYCNEFLVKETYNGTSYWTIPIGSVCSMLGQIMELRLGGVAPMYTNENNLGGQLNKTVKRQKYNFDADSLDVLDAAGVNPIINDSFYGLMITSQKTAQSPITLTDWSFLGHQMSFDLFRAEVKQGVMLPQIGKTIDTFHMNLRHQQAQALLNKRLAGPQAIWTDGAVFVETVNTEETKAENTFVIKVRVKVTPFSEFVELVFTNVAQTSSVT